ncbi:VOC family protein [Paenibacillus sp. EC2-1]|uniref:VOC family protein n=1 Tax=Paenibacillus sp. EC2-1 TaxID=3388665 RepID=UPI003BEEECF1
MKLSEVILRSHQLEEIKGFYGTLLGLDVLEDQPLKISFQAGSTRFTFCKASMNEQTHYHIAFTIPTNKYSEAKQWLNGRGISLFSKDGQNEFIFENWNATAMYFYDPDGNLVEFIAHHTLNNSTNEVFGPQHLLRISEIGLPSDNVSQAAQDLKDNFGLELWSGDGVQFAALGDAEGLLIVVDKQRLWFPDGSTPGIFETKVTMEGTNLGRIVLQSGLYEISNLK